MTSGQPTEAHLRIAHSIEEQIIVSHFGERRRRVLGLVVRLSLGCGKKTAFIPRQRDFEAVGVGEGHVKADIDWLINAAVIGRNGRYYTFNKDFEQWQVRRPATYLPETLSDLVGLNLKVPDPSSAAGYQLTERVSPSRLSQPRLKKD